MLARKTTNHTQALTDFVSCATYEDLPEDVVECTKRVILDTLGCGVGGYTVAKQKVILDVAKDLGGRPEATILVRGDCVSAPAAAFANAELANALDADETLLISTHVGSVVVASALAAAERAKASGKDLITAVALGYDVAARIGLSLVRSRVVDGKVETSPVFGLGCATLGGAMAAGKILGLSAEKLADAMGIAGAICPSPVGGKLGEEPRLTTLKVMPKMVLAHSAVLAALLSERGLTGDRAILDGQRGFWRFQSALGSNWDLLTGALGREYWIKQSAIKPYPACRFIHYALDLLYKIMSDQKLAVEEVRAVTVRISASRKRLFAANPDLEQDHSDPATVINLQFHIPYLMAVAALGIPPGPGWYATDLLLDPRIRDFVKRVSIEIHPRAADEEQRAIREEPTARSKKFPTHLSVLARGQTFEAETDYALGDPYFPDTRMSNDRLKDKFRTFCGGILHPDKIEEAIQAFWGLEQVRDVSRLMPLLSN